MRRYVASTNYVLNTAVGYNMMTMAAIALLVSGREKLAMFPEIPAFSQGIERAAPAVLAFFVLLSCTTASAVSLEGKHLWILKALPVGVREIFLSKMAVNLSLAVPAILLNATVFAVVFRFGLLQTLMLYVLPLTSALFITAGACD
jgi:ABC-2 type transport system permease protein